MPTPVTIPENIVVHLGTPSAGAENLTVPFADYIKNVASSEIYPTWPEAALRANIFAQVSYTLNRVFTDWYRSQGFDFDITNSTRFDQSYVRGRNIFENISVLVDELFNDYLVRGENIEPLFAQYCNGTTTTCDGLSQWGSASLAEQGLTADQIVRRYYGEDINFVIDAPVSPNLGGEWPGVSYRLGDVNENITTIQRRLNRVSTNYPNIPKIEPTNGIFAKSTEDAVRAFQSLFNLSPDGIVGKATWYRLAYLNTSVRKLAELNSEGLQYADISRQYPEELSEGMEAPYIGLLQYLLSVLGAFYDEIPQIIVNNRFGTQTREAVEAYQRLVALPVTGVVDLATWNALLSTYNAVILSESNTNWGNGAPAYPGSFLVEGSSGDAVRSAQQAINTLAASDARIPSVAVDGSYGPATTAAIRTIQQIGGLPVNGAIGPLTWALLFQGASEIESGNRTTLGQYPGYVIGREGTV